MQAQLVLAFVTGALFLVSLAQVVVTYLAAPCGFLEFAQSHPHADSLAWVSQG
jgi:hypothetical protein